MEGHFGNPYDKRVGQVQTYTDGTPIQEFDSVVHTQAPGGLLPPTTTVGVARFCPWGNAGELYVQYAPRGYTHMNGTTERA